jgi:DNA-binding SARP family transcriptional activator/TolB-like protein
MLRGNRFRLLTLGRLTFEGETGEEDGALAGRRSRLAVLAMLAMARRPITRDALVGMFWGEQDEARARHSLSNVLSSFRRVLGGDALGTRENEIALAPDVPLDVDALEMADAVERRDFAKAIELYGGPFLDGVFVDDSPGFEQWASRERRRLEALFVQACAEHCAALATARRWEECAAVSARWLDVAPLSPDAAIYLLNALRAPGTRVALARAIAEYEELRTRLAREFELKPEKPVLDLVARIRERLAAAPADPVPDAKSPAADATEVAATATATTPRARRSTLLWSIGSATVAVIALLSFLHWGLPRLRAGTSVEKPVIAVLTLDLGTIDSTAAWLADGVPQMIAGKLARSAAVDIVPAERARAVLARSGRRSENRLSDEQARDVANRVGATLVARGTLGSDGQNLVLDLTVHDVGEGDLVLGRVLTRGDAVALADEAAVRILEAANVRVPGPQFAGLETTSLEAYQHYLRALAAAHTGRLAEHVRELDAAIALDSGFIAALRTRIGISSLDQDSAIVARLRDAIWRNSSRASEFDRRYQETYDAYATGERERATALGRDLVRRYPRDPRGYHLLQSILGSHGSFEEAGRIAEQAVALDSLAIEAGAGPCAACVGLSGIVNLYWVRGDHAGAADWARRWIRAQPDGGPPWASLAWTYSYMQRADSAIPLMQRAVSLSGGDVWAGDEYVHMLLVGRRYEDADSAIARMEASRSIEQQVIGADLRALLERERGRIRESNRVIDRMIAAHPAAAGFGEMMRADNLRIIGSHAEAARRFEAPSHGRNDRLTLPISSVGARAFCWHHALAADALAGSGDTVRLRFLADSLERGCHRSVYGRDWRLYHHVRGLLAMHGRRYAEAEREFRQAVWTPIEGWGRITVELASAQLALGRPRDAISTLRMGYATRLEAMGRYVPISELDYRMAKAFAQAGAADSARVYADFVRRAWRDADPEFRQLLAGLP